jgi:hypothetical protein
MPSQCLAADVLTCSHVLAHSVPMLVHSVPRVVVGQGANLQ